MFSIFLILIGMERCYQKSHDPLFGAKYGRNQGMKDCKVFHSPIYGYRALKYISYLFPKEVIGKKLVRVGGKHDGGYSMLDDFSNVRTAYGFGVGWDWTWDLDLASRGIDVFMFDPTIRTPKINNSHVKFYHLGISVKDIPDKRVYSLESILRFDDNLNKTNMIFKIDIEGGEWEILTNISSSTFEKFSQILIEFHWLDKVLLSDDKFFRGLSVLEKLNRTHELVWVHSCNHYPCDVFGGVPLPRIFEVTYVKRTETDKFLESKRKRRVDERSNLRNGELLLWWVEGGGNVDIDGLINYYEMQSFPKKFTEF